MSENDGSSKPQGEVSTSSEAALDSDSVRDVFVSYASQDVIVANAVVLALERSRVTCWIAPRDVIPGALYADGIIRAITGSKAFVLVLSQHAIASKHVGKEVERASSKGRPIVTLRTDTAPLTRSLEYFLSESQWIDFQAGRETTALTKVVDAVRRHMTAEHPPEDRAESNTPGIAKFPGNDNRVGMRRLRRRSIAAMAVVGVLALAAAYFTVGRHGRFTPRSEAELPGASIPAVPAGPIISEKSVAVLPFVDMSEKKDQEYFSDGLSEELIDMLSKISDLRVPARTSSFYFKGKSEDIPTIAKRLLVAHILEGSVRKSGNHIRITVQLVRADNGYHVWSQTYDRTVDDIFKVQDDIAGAVVKALKISLLDSGISVASQTSNADAYLLYLKGTALFQRNNPQDNDASIATLNESLKLDPVYAPTWAMLARAQRMNYEFGHAKYADASASVHTAAERSVELDPKLPAAHVALAVGYYLDWNWDAADEALKRALALEPGNPLALHFASFLALDRAQNDLALRYAEAALVRDPLDFSAITTIQRISLIAGQNEIAEAQFRKCVDLYPAQGGVHATFAYYRFLKGDVAGALVEIEKEPEESDRLFDRVLFLDALGRRPEADADFALFIKKYAASTPFSVAATYARRGDADHAFEWLERAYQQHDDDLPSLKNSLGFKGLHADPRFKAMRRKMNLPE